MTRRKRTKTGINPGRKPAGAARCVMHLTAGTFITKTSDSTNCIHGHSMNSRCWQCEPLKPLDKKDPTRCRHGKTWNEDCIPCVNNPTKATGAKMWDSKTNTYKPYSGGAGTSYGTYRNCDHWQNEFDMLDGQKILLSAYSDRPNGYKATNMARKGQVTITPDIGFYLDDLWVDDNQVMASPGTRVSWAIKPNKPTNQVVLFPWRDYGTPRDMQMLANGTRWLLKKIESGAVVEIGCIGGHGRTGTMLACLLVAQGMPAKDAVAMVRRKHCDLAIENMGQVKFINAVALELNDEEVEEFDPRTVDEPATKPLYDIYGRRAWEEENATSIDYPASTGTYRWWEDEDDDQDSLLNYGELATEWGLTEQDVKELFDKGLVTEATPLHKDKADFCRYCGADIPPRNGEITCPKCEPQDWAEVRPANSDDNVAYQNWQQRVYAMSEDDNVVQGNKKRLRCALDNMDD